MASIIYFILYKLCFNLYTELESRNVDVELFFGVMLSYPWIRIFPASESGSQHTATFTLVNETDGLSSDSSQQFKDTRPLIITDSREDAIEMKSLDKKRRLVGMTWQVLSS